MNMNLREAEHAAYAAGDTLKAKLLARIVDLEDKLERVKYAAADDSLTAWESDHGPASVYVDFFFDCFERLRCRYAAMLVEELQVAKVELANLRTITTTEE